MVIYTISALSCPRGGFLFVRHNEIRDSIAHLLKGICHDVCVEPGLQPLTGENLSYRSAVVDDGACLDIAARGFWVFHTSVPTSMYVYSIPILHLINQQSCGSYFRKVTGY